MTKKSFYFNEAIDAYKKVVDIATEKGINKRQLSIASGMMPQHLSSLLTKKTVKLESVKRIAEAVGYDVEICLTEKNQE